MIGNKADLDSQREVTYEEAKQFADENGKFIDHFVNLLLLHWIIIS
jgi:Ras family